MRRSTQFNLRNNVITVVQGTNFEQTYNLKSMTVFTILKTTKFYVFVVQHMTTYYVDQPINYLLYAHMEQIFPKTLKHGVFEDSMIWVFRIHINGIWGTTDFQFTLRAENRHS